MRAMIILEKIGIPILPHDEAILPQMTGWPLLGSVLWARLIHHGLKVELRSSKPGRLSFSLTMLVITLYIGVSYKV